MLTKAISNNKSFYELYKKIFNIIFIVLAGYFIGKRFTSLTSLLLLLILSSGILILIKPRYGFFVFLSMFYFTPKIGNIVSIPILKSISVATLFSLFLIFIIWSITVLKKENYLVKTPLNWPFAFVVLSYILSDASGFIYSGYEFTLSAFFNISISVYPFLLFIAIIYFSKKIKKKENILKLVVGFSFIPAVIGILEWYNIGNVRNFLLRFYVPSYIEDMMSSYPYDFNYRSSSLYNYETNLFGVFTSFMAVLSLILLLNEKNKRYIFIWRFLFLLNTVSQFFSMSRTAVMTLLFGIAIGCFFYYGIKIKALIGISKNILTIVVFLFGVVYFSSNYLGIGHFFNRLSVDGDFTDLFDSIMIKNIQLKKGIGYGTLLHDFNPIFGIGWSNYVDFVNDIGWIYLFSKVGFFGLCAEIFMMLCVLKLANKTYKLVKGTAATSIPIFLIFFVLNRSLINFGGVYWGSEIILQLYWIVMGLCVALYHEQISTVNKKGLRERV